MNIRMTASDAVRDYYEADFAVAQFTSETGLYPIESEWIAKYFPPAPATILDIACGAGRTSGPLAERGYLVHAVDLSLGLLVEGRKRFPDLSFAQMNAKDLAFRDGAFDAAIFSVQGLDHLFPLGARLACLHEVFRVLRPGGRFLMSTHNLIGEFIEPLLRRPASFEHPLRLARWQFGNSHLAHWYARYEDDGGAMLGYAAPPRWTRKQLTQTGFVVLAESGANWGPNGGVVESGHGFTRSTFVYFAAEKPRA